MKQIDRIDAHARPLARRAARRLEPLAHRAGLAGADIVPLAVMVLCALVTLVGVEVGAEVYESVRERVDLAALDQPVLDWMVAHRTPDLDAAVTTFTHLGGPVWFPLILAALLAFFTWKRRSASPAVLLLGGIGGALAFTLAGKDLTDRLRPPRDLAIPPFESSPSFPSGHTITATVAGALVMYLTVRTVSSVGARVVVGILTSGWALLMGLSRVYLGHHWLTDVVAGWALGLAWAAVVIILNEARLLLRARHRRLHPQEGARGGEMGHPASR